MVTVAPDGAAAEQVSPGLPGKETVNVEQDDALEESQETEIEDISQTQNSASVPNVEDTMGEMNPEVLFNVMSSATVQVKQLPKEGQNRGVYISKIATLIGGIRVGCDDFKSEQKETGELQMSNYEVAVPQGSELHIEVETSNIEGIKHLEVFQFSDTCLNSRHEVDANIIEWGQAENIEDVVEHEFIVSPKQSSRLVEVKVLSGHLTVVYTIGDEISFTEFIMALRHIAADYPGRQDILDKNHGFLNLSSTRQHPVLREHRGGQPHSWLHVKLQVVEDSKTSLTDLQQSIDAKAGLSGDSIEEDKAITTLVIRADNMYISGFFNKKGVLYRLVDEKSCKSLIPDGYGNHIAEDLKMGTNYSSLLKIQNREDMTEELVDLDLGKAFAMDAVRVLSKHPREIHGMRISAGEALAGLIVIVCECARMNNLHQSFVDGWNNGRAFIDKELMDDYILKYGSMSGQLLQWKTGGYGGIEQPHTPPILELKTIYLVLNTGNEGSPTNQPGDADDADSGGDDPDRQPKEADHADSHGSSGGSNTGDSRQPSKGSKNQRKATDSKGPNKDRKMEGSRGQVHGRPRVELLAIRADPGVVCTEIIVSDGKRGQIIYTTDEREQAEKKLQGEPKEKKQGEQDTDDLVLTGPNTGISAYGSFAIEIHVSNPTEDSSSGNTITSGPIKWEWDRYDKKYAAEVDKQPVSRRIVYPLDPRRMVAEVTYAVISNALEATVQVMLRLKDRHNPGGVQKGKITSFIGDFKVGSALFSHTQGTMCQCFSPSGDSWFLLQLSRNVVAVPCGKQLRIAVDLHIETSNKHLAVDVEFANGIPFQQRNFNGVDDEIEVSVDWYPEAKMMVDAHLLVEVDIIRDSVSLFTGFITDLRRLILEKHPHRREVIMEHPLLARQRAEQPARWIHVELQVGTNKEKSSITLLMRDDDLCVHGFMNLQRGRVCCYELVDDNDGSISMLPKDYHPRRLAWGINYRTILGVDRKQAVVDKLASAKLGKNFMVNAVRVLSKWSHLDQQQVPQPASRRNTKMSARVALAGLIFMVCESARMNYVCNSIADGWSSGKAFTKELMDEYVCKYGEMSSKLRAWKSRNYAEPHCIRELQAMYLVLNTWLPADYNAQGHGRARVELLALSMREDLLVDGMKIVVFDGKRGQIIYRKEQGKEEEKQQGEAGMVHLVLTGPYTCISATYGCFAIKIDIPRPPASSSGGGNKHASSTEWEWDFHNRKHAAQVDKRRTCGTITSDDGRKVASITYVVLSDALEATVQVKLRLKGGHSPGGISGKVTARNKHKSILFMRTKGKGQRFSIPNDDSWLLLELARNVVAVQCGRELYIQVKLKIEADDGKEVKREVHLHFDNGIRSTQTDDSKEVEVQVNWYPEIAPPEQITSQEAGEQKTISAPTKQIAPSEIVPPSQPPEQITSKKADIISTPSEQSGPTGVI